MQRLKHYINKNIVYVIACLFIVARLIGITRTLWADEYITLNTLDVNPLKDPFLLSATTNLPLFFYIFRVWGYFFDTSDILLLRAFPVILSVVNFLIWIKIFKDSDSTFKNIFLVVFSIVPLQIYYSQELRPYILAQVIISAIFYFVFVANRSKNAFFFSVVAIILGLFTHYAVHFIIPVILFSAIFFSNSWHERKKLVALTLLSVSLSVLIYFYYSTTPQFISSFESVEIGSKSFLEITFTDFSNMLNKVKEVVSIYYWFGLKYYLVSPFVQFWFKKIVVIFATFGFIAAFKEQGKSIKKIVLGSGLILFITLFATALLEVIGYYPFGGRHIMPYSVFLYVLVAYFLFKVYSFGRLKYLAIVFLLIFTALFTFHNSCLFYFLPANYEKTVPHEDAYNQCQLEIRNKFL